MKRSSFITVILILLVTYSCSIFEDELPDPWSDHPYLKGDGAFVVNEGNFLAGNGSISFYSFDSLKIYNDLFKTANGRPLGDIPNSMVISGGKAYIVVNNSGKIEIVDIHNMQSLGTITGLDSPRNILILNQDKAYVTSLYSKELTILDLKTNSVAGKINIRRTSEAIVRAGNKVYISCWTSANKIVIVNPESDQVLDSVTVGQEPESMVLDKENRLWILCTGGYSGQHYPELLAISTYTDLIVKRFTFPSKYTFPSSLAINGSGDTLYYIGGEVWRLATSDASLPESPFVEARGRLFYKIGIHPAKGYVFVTNAVDYRQRGYLLKFDAAGTVLDSVQADVIPGALYFKPESE